MNGGCRICCHLLFQKKKPNGFFKKNITNNCKNERFPGVGTYRVGTYTNERVEYRPKAWLLTQLGLFEYRTRH